MANTGQAARGNWISSLRHGLSILILAVSGVANAQYFFSVVVPPAGPPDCNADSVYFSSLATLSWSLPPPPNNQVFLTFINGVALPADVETQVPSGTEMVDIDLSLPGSHATPYTVVVQAFPAINGSPVGTGAQVRIQCNILGAGQGTAICSSVAAPTANYQGLWWADRWHRIGMGDQFRALG